MGRKLRALTRIGPASQRRGRRRSCWRRPSRPRVRGTLGQRRVRARGGRRAPGHSEAARSNAAGGATPVDAQRPLRAGRHPDPPAGSRATGSPIGSCPSQPRSQADPQGQARQTNEFGYVTQIREAVEDTRRGRRGAIIPASTGLGNPAADPLLPDTVGQLTRLHPTPRDRSWAADATWVRLASAALLPHPERVFVSDRRLAWRRRTQLRLQHHRTGAEAWISYPNRAFRMNRSFVKARKGGRSGQGGRSWLQR